MGKKSFDGLRELEVGIIRTVNGLRLEVLVLCEDIKKANEIKEKYLMKGYYCNILDRAKDEQDTHVGWGKSDFPALKQDAKYQYAVAGIDVKKLQDIDKRKEFNKEKATSAIVSCCLSLLIFGVPLIFCIVDRNWGGVFFCGASLILFPVIIVVMNDSWMF